MARPNAPQPANAAARAQGAGTQGQAPRKGEVHSIRWIVTSAAVALTTGAVLIVSGVAEHNTRGALEREVQARLLLEARNLALTSSEALLNDFPELVLHPLVKEMRAREPELALVLVVDRNGMIQGDPDARQLGTTYRPSTGFVPIQSRQALREHESLRTDGKVLIASAPVRHRNGQPMGTALVGIQRHYLDAMIGSARRQQTVVLAVLLLVGVVSAFLLMSLLLRPIVALRAGIERVGRGDLDTPVQLKDRTELGLLAEAINHMARQLKRAQVEMVERERLSHEVELARQIQASLLPSTRVEAETFVISGSQRAAAEVGGDYFDYFKLPDGRIGVAVADVSGKGLAGCLVMSMLSALLRALRTSYASPSSLLVALDERLSESLRPGSFVTMFYGVLNPQRGTLTYASAGHNPVMIYRAGNGKVEWIRSGGIPLGAVRGGAIQATLKDATIQLDTGDVLVQFTDGINEAFEPTGVEQFGYDRMCTAVVQSAPLGAAAVIETLHSGVREWTGDGPSLDDETILVVSREGAAQRWPTTSGAVAADRASHAVAAKENGHPSQGAFDPATALAEARMRGECLRLPSTLDALTGIRAWTVRMLPGLEPAGPQLELLVTALHEACSNVVEHAIGEDPSRMYELWWVPGSDRVLAQLRRARPTPDPRQETNDALREGYFLIRDEGKQFQADNWKRTDFSDPEVWKRRRGFGLDIIYRAMRHVTYHPGTPNGNLMIMVFEPECGSSEEKELRSA